MGSTLDHSHLVEVEAPPLQKGCKDWKKYLKNEKMCKNVKGIGVLGIKTILKCIKTVPLLLPIHFPRKGALIFDFFGFKL